MLAPCSLTHSHMRTYRKTNSIVFSFYFSAVPATSDQTIPPPIPPRQTLRDSVKSETSAIGESH